MSVKVKICGLTDMTALDAALDAGADMIGLVFFESSPRHLRFEDAVLLAERARGQATVVAVTVDPDDLLIAEIASCIRPDFIQLHGNETPERADAIRLLSGAGVIKAIKVGRKEDVATAAAYDAASDLILFDAAPPPDAALPGGNGLLFDHRLLAGADRRYVLSGGLDPGNIGEAVMRLRPFAVDVSSGVERAPGVKDPDLIARFIAAAKQEMANAS